MASITINASAGGGWYGSVTTTGTDTPEACEAACQLLEKLLAARTQRARPAKPAPDTPPRVSDDLRTEILARLANGPMERKQLLTGLGRKGSDALLDMIGLDQPVALVRNAPGRVYCLK
jgi:hypothetical protein